MKLRRFFSPKPNRSSPIHKHTPWFASPLESTTSPPSENVLRNHIFAADSTRSGPRDPRLPPFKHHHESSTIELFYDLFFVANLATFTTNHEIVDGRSLENYIGFFTLLWFTWFQTSLFDVRFASESVFDRFCKAISLGVMTGFAVTGAIYDTTNVEENVKAFRAMSIILMVSRLALVLQYAAVLWYLRNYKNTVRPLMITMATLFAAAMVFLGTFFGFKTHGRPSDSEVQEPQSLTYVAWYVVVCVEAAAVIAVSCVWRVVSFKRTHLVERVGLLTLIIMGEGIYGMTKSVSKILQSSRSTTGSDVGVIMSSVLLIYFIWVLYFDQIEHDRFGTVRQQIWAILHYPLHVAILLTVEGSSSLILWNIILRYTWVLPLARSSSQILDANGPAAILGNRTGSLQSLSILRRVLYSGTRAASPASKPCSGRATSKKYTTIDII
jgi:low temperature requirement protein LtrA